MTSHPLNLISKTAISLFLPLSLFLFIFSSSRKPFSYHGLFLSLSSNTTISLHLHSLTSHPHPATSPANSAAASYVISSLSSYSLPARHVSYSVLLSFPLSRSLTLTPSPSDPPTTFDLRQQPAAGDPSSSFADDNLPTFHAYSKSGTASGHVVYANYGRAEDFHKLNRHGVNVSGTVVLARYGKIYRGDIVKNAYQAGAAGVVVFSDAKDYGSGASDGGFPASKWLPASGVQIGTVYNGCGDPSTPGWPSSGECERISGEELEMKGQIPAIPSLPVSAGDGETILKSVGGHVADDDWQGGVDAPVYRIGPGPGFLNITYTGKLEIAAIENIISVIEGAEEPDRFVILGNHRDAWTYGAVDPNSGTATLLEIARRLGKMKKRGWRPRRSIVLCNWDGEEYGLIGSTEWVEENKDMLGSKAVAYLNVDSAVSGPRFHASATPQLDDLLKEVTQQVQDADNSSRTIYESWIESGESPLIGRLGGGGSDYASFLQHVGVPSVDMFFGGEYPVYHSLYDDFQWMQKFGDPLFHRHVAASSIWGLVALKLADEEFLPFNYLSYASELQSSIRELESKVVGKPVNLTPLYKSVKELQKAATKINSQKQDLEGNSWPLKWRKNPLQVRELNDRLMMAERAFTDREGLFERPWYKHLIYGPSKHDDYGSKSFPGIDDAIENAKSLKTTESWDFVQHQIWRVSRAITHASLVLNGEFT